jgi:hypothetical protein
MLKISSAEQLDPFAFAGRNGEIATRAAANHAREMAHTIVGIASPAGAVPAVLPEEQTMPDTHMIVPLMSGWNLPSDDDTAWLVKRCRELVAIDQKIDAVPDEEMRSLRGLHRKWLALKEREQALFEIEDQLKCAAGADFLRLGAPGSDPILHSDDEIDDWIASRFIRRTDEERERERVALKQRLADTLRAFHDAAEKLGLPAIEDELAQTQAAIEAVLDEIWEFRIESVDELAVFLDIAAGRNEIEVAEPINEAVDPVTCLQFIGRVARALVVLAPGFEFPSFKGMFLNEATAAALLAGEEGKEIDLGVSFMAPATDAAAIETAAAE